MLTVCNHPMFFHVRFAMPREPLRTLRPELFEDEQNVIDAFLPDDQDEPGEDYGLDQVS